MMVNKISCNLFENDLEGYSYFMGFAFADGYVNEKQKKMYVMSTEKEIIIKIKKRMEHTGKLCEYEKTGFGVTTRSYQINICGKYAEYFINKGMKNKKKDLMIPEDVDVYHFLRGFIDGDGYISQPNKSNKRIVVGMCAESKELLEQIQNITGGKIRKDRNIWDLRLNRDESEDLANKMYNSATIYLERKYKRYAEMAEFGRMHLT